MKILYIYLLINIDKLKTYIYEDIDKNKEFVKDKIIIDYIFISFLIGNDFIPQLPSIKIRNNGINLIITEYKKLLVKYKKNLIINEKKCVINKYFLFNLLKEISLNEEELLRDIHRNYTYSSNIRKNECEDLFMNDIKNMEIIDKTKVKNIIKYNKNGYKKRYYKCYFDLDKTENLEDYFKELNKICYNYCESLKWTLLYYTNNEIPSYEWFYKYNTSPFLIDIFNYIKYNSNIFNDIKFNKGDKLCSLEQLSLIVPEEKNYLVPEIYRNKIKEKKNYYNYEIDYQYKLFKHEALILFI